MMSRLANPYVRLTEYFRIFKTYDSSDVILKDDSARTITSIAMLSEKLELPANVVRADITNIMRYSEGGVLDFDIDEDTDLDIDFEELADNPDKIFELITEGAFDQVGLNYQDAFIGDCSVLVTSEEMDALNKISDIELPFYIKDNELVFSKIFVLPEMIALVEGAIKEHRFISFDYYEKEMQDIATYKIVPLKIVYENNKFYILTCVDGLVKSFYFENIKSEIALLEQSNDVPGSVFMTILPQVWGMDFEAEPYLVEVKFYDEGDVFNRVRAELSGRTLGELREEEGFLYYEDTVYGLDAFKEWILSFGSSAVVLKPKQLRNQIIEELKNSIA